MKTPRFAIGLTVLNLLILMSILVRAQSATTPEVASVLRARSLEIVDDLRKRLVSDPSGVS